MDRLYQEILRLFAPPTAPMKHRDLLNQGATLSREAVESLMRNSANEVTQIGRRKPSRETPQMETHVDKSKCKQEQPARKDSSLATSNPDSSYKKSACRTTQISPLGEKCLVKCTLDGVAVDALWDTGAQATIINEGWRAKHLPHTVLRPLKDLFKTGMINLRAANGTPITIIGWLNTELKLYKGENETDALTVPTLVANDSCAANRPIIGFNVIEKSKDAKLWKTKT